MPERIQCEFYLLRYVPDAVKNEFVNIGVMLREAGRAETTRVKLTRDWSRVRCVDPDADTGLLEAMEAELAERVRDGGSGRQPVMTMLEESLSTSVQMSEVRGVLAESVPCGDGAVAAVVCGAGAREGVAEEEWAGVDCAGRCGASFERAGVWELMRKRIAASAYTRPGDPLKIDCGYRPNGIIRMFQAVSLEGDLEAAKVLSYSAARLREGVQRVENGALDLAAVVEPLRSIAAEDGEAADRYRFGVETMEEAQIRVLTVADLARVAETAKLELRV